MDTIKSVWFIVLLSIISDSNGLHNGLLKTPPMGWLSWEMFGCNVRCTNTAFEGCISENLFVQIARALKQKGFLEAGYDRVNIDDCWMSRYRNVSNGELIPDPIRFPDGMEHLVQELHNLGFKAGIYQNYGKTTCMGYPGLIGFTRKDAQRFTQWKFDMIKLDSCFTPTTKLDRGFYEFSQELLRTGHKIALSCSLAYYQMFVSKTRIVPNWRFISSMCNTFRVYHDIHASWTSILKTIDFMADNQRVFAPVTGPGSWPDPDMLMIGKEGVSVEEAESQMAVWCMFPAPLLMSNDPRTITDQFVKVLLNKHAIQVNQDRLGLPGERVFHNRTLDIWRRKLDNDEMAIVILNRENPEINVQLSFKDIGYPSFINSALIVVLNVFTEDVEKFEGPEIVLDTSVQGHGVTFWRVRKT